LGISAFAVFAVAVLATLAASGAGLLAFCWGEQAISPNKRTRAVNSFFDFTGSSFLRKSADKRFVPALAISYARTKRDRTSQLSCRAVWLP